MLKQERKSHVNVASVLKNSWYFRCNNFENHTSVSIPLYKQAQGKQGHSPWYTALSQYNSDIVIDTNHTGLFTHA